MYCTSPLIGNLKCLTKHQKITLKAAINVLFANIYFFTHCRKLFNFHKCCKICIYLITEHNNNMQIASNNNFWGCLLAKCNRTLKRKLLGFFFCLFLGAVSAFSRDFFNISCLVWKVCICKLLVWESHLKGIEIGVFIFVGLTGNNYYLLTYPTDQMRTLADLWFLRLLLGNITDSDLWIWG